MVAEQYEANCYQNGVFEDDQEELKQKAIKVCEIDFKIQFPEGTELLYANSDKGDLFDLHFATSFKLKIKKEKRYNFEDYIRLGNIEGVDFKQIKSDEFYAGRRGPRAIWKPEVLKDTTCYTFDRKNSDGHWMFGGRIYLGKDKDGVVYIYIFYGV